MRNVRWSRRLEPAIEEIAARLGAGARLRARLEEFRREFHHVIERLRAPSRAPRPRAWRAGSGTPASAASRSTASGNDSPSVSITKSKMSPFLPEEKSNHALLVVDEEGGRLLLIEGRQALPFPPGLFAAARAARRPPRPAAGRGFLRGMEWRIAWTGPGIYSRRLYRPPSAGRRRGTGGCPGYPQGAPGDALPIGNSNRSQGAP